MAINSKSKGNKFERDISEKLSLWLTDGKEKRACWRSDSSGASATNWAKKGLESRYVKANAGDIRKIAEKGDYAKLDTFFDEYVVECKHYKQIDFYPPCSGTLAKFLDQCIEEKKSTGKKIALILKANNKKTLYCIEGPGFLELANQGLPYAMQIRYKDLLLHIYSFDDVVKTDYVNRTSADSDKRDRTWKDREL